MVLLHFLKMFCTSMFVHRNFGRYIIIHVLTILGLLRSFALPYLNFQTTPSKYIPTLVMNGKKIRFLIFLRCRATRRFWIYLLLIWLFFDPIIKPPKKDYKRKNQKHLCFGGRFAFLFKRSFFGLRVRYFSLVVVTNFQKIGASSWKKKLNERRKFSVRLSLMNDLAWTTNMFFSSLASCYYKRIIAKILLSRSLFFSSSRYLSSLVVVFRILCTFLAIFFVKIKLKKKNQYLI